MALLAGWALVCLAPASDAGAAPSVASLEITGPGQLTALDSGGSSTPFGLLLPSGARCPGDTAHHGYHVFSYLVPQRVSPASVRFTSVPDRGLGLFAVGGVYFGALNTAEYTGQIVDLPGELTFARLSPSLLFSFGDHAATWNAGLACATSNGVVTSYWNARIRFSASARDQRGFTWAVVSSAHVASPSGDAGIWLAVALIAAAVVLSGVAFRLRRQSTREPDGGT